MSYDPCGTQRLEGGQILKRLAEHLGISVADLSDGLQKMASVQQTIRQIKGEKA